MKKFVVSALVAGGLLCGLMPEASGRAYYRRSYYRAPRYRGYSYSYRRYTYPRYSYRSYRPYRSYRYYYPRYSYRSYSPVYYQPRVYYAAPYYGWGGNVTLWW